MWRAWSPDGRAAVVSQDTHTLVNRCFISRDGQLRPLLPDARHVEAVRWLPGRILAVTDLDRDFHGLVAVDPGRPSRVDRVLYDEDHDVLAICPDPAGQRIALVVNEGGWDGIHILDLGQGTRFRCRLPPGTVYSDGATDPEAHLAWSDDGRSLFLSWESSTAPAEILQVPADPGAEPVRWTDVAGPLPPGLVRPAHVELPSFDGLRIPGLLYRAGDGPRPTVLWFHGGPEGQSRDIYNPAIAMWNAAGYHVLAPNVRGSTGYGHRFASLDDRELRWDSVRDACAAGRWLLEQGHATALVVTGRSYGGFLALAALTEEPSLWSAGVVIAGIADWHSFFRHTSPWRRAMRIPEYGDPSGPDGRYLAAFSPLARADRISAPLLVIHGENDARVPVSEARQLHAAVPGSELLVFPGEGHHISRLSNLTEAYQRALGFIQRALDARCLSRGANPDHPLEHRDGQLTHPEPAQHLHVSRGCGPGPERETQFGRLPGAQAERPDPWLDRRPVRAAFAQADPGPAAERVISGVADLDEPVGVLLARHGRIPGQHGTRSAGRTIPHRATVLADAELALG